MRQRKTKPKVAKVVWRISDAAPLGEYVHVDMLRDEPPAVPAADSAEGLPRGERGWHHSSHDLVHGVEVHEEPLDTLSDDMLAELFKPKK
jgi:hypothetical protein